MTPYAYSWPNRYSRLLPPETDRFDPASPGDQRLGEVLYNLVAAMPDNGAPVSSRTPPQDEILMNAGFTYFGQLVDHDMTRDTSSVSQVWTLEPDAIRNGHSPWLDLDNLYGKGPDSSSRSLYEADGMSLRVGAPGGRGQSFDVAMGTVPDSRGEFFPLVADDRTVENVILRQMMAVFARLHNLAVARTDASLPAPVRFRLARQKTVWTYQWLVCGDFVRKILSREVYDEFFGAGPLRVAWEGPFSIPVEFSVGAMRFGHSMVRENYFLRDGHDARLKAILARSLEAGPLTSEWEVGWDGFFQGAGHGGAAMTARPIDTRVAPGLLGLEPPTIRLFGPVGPEVGTLQDPLMLPLRTLTRGVRLRMASGQEAAEAFGLPRLTTEQLTRDDAGRITPQGQILLDSPGRIGDARLLERTPLWYYLLKESEVRLNGNQLGPTGSYLVALTIHAAMRDDPNSLWNAPGQKRQPPLWPTVGGGPERPMEFLSDLFALAPFLDSLH